MVTLAASESYSPPRGTAALPPFRERAPWLGGDLQTLRNFLWPPAVDLAPFRTERLILPLLDGSGDHLVGTMQWPAEVRRRPVVVIIHGLTGCEESIHVRLCAADLLRAGFPVLRLNLRGAGPSLAFCRLHYHAGRSQDLADALAGMPARVKERGLVALGFSFGGGILLKYLGEVGGVTPLQAAVTVSTPIDLEAASRRVMERRNRIYHWSFLRDIRRQFTAGLPEKDVRLAQEVQSLWEFDEQLTAPRNGFASAADYYRRSSAQRFLAGIAVPTLLLHAINDPIVPVEAYRDFPWTRNRRLIPAIESKGGHVGFHNRGGGVWYHQAAELFFRRVLSLS